jgi:uncharacterized protein (TIGR01777 family)
MRIGVTGASGFLGSALVAALEQRGDTVVRFVRDGASGPGRIAWRPADGFIDSDALDADAPLDALVHLAGAGIGDKRWSKRRRDEIKNSRTQSTALLAQTFATRPLAHFVCGSAIGFYGPRGDEWLTERSSEGEGFLSDVCGAWEQEAFALSDSDTIVTTLRTGVVLAASGGALKKQLPLFRLGLGGKLGSGNQWMSVISLRDEVRAIVHVLDQRISGAVNLVSPEPLQNKDFTKALSRAMHRPAFFTVPSLALSIALGSGMANEAVLCSQRVLPTALQDSGFLFEDPTIDAVVASALAS